MNECPGIVEIQEGRYLYSVINSGALLCLGDIGINDSSVFTICHKDIAAVVHSCQAEAYRTQDNLKAKEWILAHNYVIDTASKKFGTVLPFAFDTIVKGNNETIKIWLNENYETLKNELDKFNNKDEYSVQVFCYQDMLIEKLARSDRELNELKDEMDKASKGTAYLIKRKFELKKKDAIRVEISKLSDEFYSELRELVEKLKVEPNPSKIPGKYEGMKPIVEFSCLVHKDDVEKLGEVLDKINEREGFAVRFTGPWAPFSFVDLKED